MRHQTMQQHARDLHPDIVVHLGDYPYAAWYTKESYDLKEWEGYWFANPLKFIDIYIPFANYTLPQRVFAFAHELGHVMDFLEHRSQWDKVDALPHGLWTIECSAWARGLQFLMKNRYFFTLDDFRTEMSRCLSTYLKDAPEGTNLPRVLDSIVDGSFKCIGAYKI